MNPSPDAAHFLPTMDFPNADIRVNLMQAEDRIRWDAFVDACPEATFFHRSGWQEVIQQALGHKTWFYMAEQSGVIVGILPLAQIKSILFGHALVSLPFCVYGGIATTTEVAREALNQAAQSLARQLAVGHLEYRSINSHHSDWQSKELYVTFRKTIEPDEESNMLAIPRKQRAMVRKGIKAGLRSEIDQDIERFFLAYSSSVHRLGTPVFSKKFFRLLKQVFGKDCEILTILQGEQVISSVLSFYFRDEVLPYYGGGTVTAREVAGNDFMYWELMRRACARGYRIFDFGRSKFGTGAFDFKKNWGFEPQALHYEYKLYRASSLPENNPLNPKFRLFIQIWQHLPLSVTNFLGPYIVKQLG